MMLELEPLAELDPKVPKIKVTHDDEPQLKRSDELKESKLEYARAKVILLSRDPRDALVSNYFEKKHRMGLWADAMKQKKALSSYVDRLRAYGGELSHFLYEPVGGFDTFIKFYNIWAANRAVPEAFLLVRYEDLHHDTAGEVRGILDFLGLPDIGNKIIAEAVEYASFNKMRRMEYDGVFNSPILCPADKSNEDSYKTRRGKVGGFLEYLMEEEVTYLTARTREELDGLFRY